MKFNCGAGTQSVYPIFVGSDHSGYEFVCLWRGAAGNTDRAVGKNSGRRIGTVRCESGLEAVPGPKAEPRCGAGSRNSYIFGGG